MSITHWPSTVPLMGLPPCQALGRDVEFNGFTLRTLALVAQMRNLIFRLIYFFLPNMAYATSIQRLIALFSKADERNAELLKQIAMLSEQLVVASSREAASEASIALLAEQAEQARQQAQQAQEAFETYKAADLAEDTALEAFIAAREQAEAIPAPVIEEPVPAEPAPVEPVADPESSDVVAEPVEAGEAIDEEVVEA